MAVISICCLAPSSVGVLVIHLLLHICHFFFSLFSYPPRLFCISLAVRSRHEREWEDVTSPSPLCESARQRLMHDNVPRSPDRHAPDAEENDAEELMSCLWACWKFKYVRWPTSEHPWLLIYIYPQILWPHTVHCAATTSVFISDSCGSSLEFGIRYVAFGNVWQQWQAVHFTSRPQVTLSSVLHKWLRLIVPSLSKLKNNCLKSIAS